MRHEVWRWALEIVGIMGRFSLAAGRARERRRCQKTGKTSFEKSH
jgi:hypothetical protein